ncbi:unnamed protein product [Toxocara canis]|uniref:Secreted protein n=1 Tax=Toxocara canis TaxID=6265 RepID=A0A183UNT0_TOXCA|nr:unnamed protein product [Toxocara canis]
MVRLVAKVIQLVPMIVSITAGRTRWSSLAVNLSIMYMVPAILKARRVILTWPHCRAIDHQEKLLAHIAPADPASDLSDSDRNAIDQALE